MTQRVLLVEDSVVQAEMLRDDLLAAGYEVRLATDGHDALRQLGEARADAVVTDVMMPGMGGYELCRRIKADRQTADIPVVLLTSLRDPVDIVRGLECGADNFITKPYELDQLLHRLDTVLRSQDLRAAGRFRMGVEVLVLGHTFTVSAERQQILDMLMSSFEELVNTNDRLREREEQLEQTQAELTAQIALSEQRREQLEESRAQLRHTLEVTGVATWKLALPEARFEWSENALSTLGLAPDTSIDTVPEFLSRVVEEDAAYLEGLVEALVADPSYALPDEWELRVVGRDDRTRTFSGRLAGVEQAADGGVTANGIVVDVTRRRQLEEALEQARDEAERANRAKSEYLSRMSHELRTPMNSVLGFAQLLELSELAPEDRDSAERILAAGRHLLTLIDDVLDIARIESGNLTVSLEPVSVDDTVTAAVDLIRPQLADRQLTLSVTTGGCHEDHLLADRQRLLQVLINLLSNAVKYNAPEGQVTVACRTTAPGWHRVTVADTGPGIPPEAQERLFTPFDRLGADRSEITGTGLGLALSHSLVEAMGGHIGCDSTPGEGSTFWIELPVAPDPDPDGSATAGVGDAAVPSTDAAPPVTLLYVEDNPLNLELVRRALAYRPGTTLLHATSGEDGLAVAAEARPDLVLLDLHLPGVSGREVLQRLRSREHSRAVPVVVLSADATTTSAADILAAGADRYLTKPFDLLKLRRTVDELLEADQ
jgi:signal transduction histidine kinase/DNA-binding response OmpR family regulator